MESERTDAELMVLSLREPGMFSAIFDRHFDGLRAYVARQFGASDATDVAAEAFRVAFENRGRFDHLRSDSCRPWLLGIARNLARKREQQRARSVLVERLDDWSAIAPDDPDRIDAVLDARARYAVVLAALRHLDPEAQELLTLVAWEELTYQEAAIVLGLPVGTVRSRLSRARARLRQLVERQSKEPCHD